MDILLVNWLRQNWQDKKRMKFYFDRCSECHIFHLSDHVLALLQLTSYPFQAKFLGLFTVVKQVTDQNYIVYTPKRKTQVHHAKLYYESVTLCHQVLHSWR